MLLLRSSFFLFIFLSALQDAAAQNFGQVNQLPLQLNPSLAGSKGKKRISAGINKLGCEQYTERNIALGYDQLSQKLHAGIGIYYLNYKKDSHLINNEIKPIFPEPISKKDFYTKNSQQFIGICIAPKYNIYYKNHPKKIKYTFSPSVFMEAGKEHFSTIANVCFKEYYTSSFSSRNPQGLKQSDSIHSVYTRYGFTNTFFHSGIGLQLNSGKLIVLSKSTYAINTYKESLQQCTYSSATALEEYNSTNLQRTLHAIESNIHIGYTFSISKKSDLTVTPILGIGIKHYLNLLPTSGSAELYRNNVSNASITELNYVHASGNFRYKKLLFGACYTKYFSTVYEGLTLGYQSDLVKLMLTGGAGIASGKPGYRNIEITTDIFF